MVHVLAIVIRGESFRSVLGGDDVLRLQQAASHSHVAMLRVLCGRELIVRWRCAVSLHTYRLKLDGVEGGGGPAAGGSGEHTAAIGRAQSWNLGTDVEGRESGEF